MRIIHCRCPACGAGLKVNAALAGRSGKCPKCSAKVEIAADSAAEELSVPKPTASEDGSFPHIVTDPSVPGDQVRRGAATTAGHDREGGRASRRAVWGAATAVGLMVVGTGVLFLCWPSRDSVPPQAETTAALPAKPEPEETSQVPAAEPAPPEPSHSTLVLDWPVSERPESIIVIDGVEHPVPSSGPVELEVMPGAHEVVIERRGYEPVEMSIDFRAGGHHHCEPQWKEPSPAMIAADTIVPPGPAADPPAEPAAAQPQPAEEDPQTLLAGKGLDKIGEYFVLPEESQLSQKLREAESLKKQVFDAQQRAEQARRMVDNKEMMVLALVQRRGELGAMMRSVRTVGDNNRIVGAINEVEARIAVASMAEQEEKVLEQARAAAITKTGEYEESLLGFRRAYDEVRKQYEALAASSEVTQAIQRYNQTSPRACRLGPRTLFPSIGRKLQRLEETMLSEAVALRRGNGDQWYVSVMFNGKHACELVVDTGASIINLPWDVAQKVGLTPGAGDQVIYVQVADGRIVPATRVVAKTIRVGKFEVKNVECTVMPAGMPGAPLLGMSFFKNFNFRIDPGKNQLIMTQVTAESDQ